MGIGTDIFLGREKSIFPLLNFPLNFGFKSLKHGRWHAFSVGIETKPFDKLLMPGLFERAEEWCRVFLSFKHALEQMT